MALELPALLQKEGFAGCHPLSTSLTLGGSADVRQAVVAVSHAPNSLGRDVYVELYGDARPAARVAVKVDVVHNAAVIPHEASTYRGRPTK